MNDPDMLPRCAQVLSSSSSSAFHLGEWIRADPALSLLDDTAGDSVDEKDGAVPGVVEADKEAETRAFQVKKLLEVRAPLSLALAEPAAARGELDVRQAVRSVLTVLLARLAGPPQPLGPPSLGPLARHLALLVSGTRSRTLTQRRHRVVHTRARRVPRAGGHRRAAPGRAAQGAARGLCRARRRRVVAPSRFCSRAIERGRLCGAIERFSRPC